MVVHLLYFYSDFLRDPFQATPASSPDCHLFSAATAYQELTHPRPAGIIGMVSFASVRHEQHHTLLPPTGGSTVSSATADTFLQTDLASFRDSVQSSLDNIQDQLEETDTLTHNLESNFYIGLNNRFGTMSARIMEFQSSTEK